MKRFMCVFLLTLLFLTPPLLAADVAVQNQGKLDTVLANQQEILRQLDEIKKELQIVKARATR